LRPKATEKRELQSLFFPATSFAVRGWGGPTRKMPRNIILAALMVLLWSSGPPTRAVMAFVPSAAPACRGGILSGRQQGYLKQLSTATVLGARLPPSLSMCGSGAEGAHGPFYPLTEIQSNTDQQQLAVAREDYASAARLRDANQALRERDEFTRISSHLGHAAEEERFEDAAALRDALIVATMRRAACPPPLNRLLLLTAQRELATCNPDGSDLAPLTARDSMSGRRYTQPTWSPSGDLVAAVAYTGTALSSTVGEHHLVQPSSTLLLYPPRGAGG